MSNMTYVMTTSRDDRYTTGDRTTSRYTSVNMNNNTIQASGPQNEGGSNQDRLRPSQWPTAAVLGGIILLALIGILVVLLYRKKRQRDYHKRHKSSEERVGFIDAEAENRRSDIALQLLQVTDPSYFELEEAAQNAKLQELQGQNDLNIMEIIQGQEAQENDGKGSLDTKNSDKCEKSSTKEEINAGNNTSIGSVSGALVNDIKRTTDNSVPGDWQSEQNIERKSDVSVANSKENKTTVPRSSNTGTDSNPSAKRNSEKVRSTRLSSNIRKSNVENGDHGNGTTGQDLNPRRSVNNNKTNITSDERQTEEQIKQRRSARSSGGYSTEKRTSEKLKQNTSVQLPVNGVSDVTRPTSTRSSKHSSVSYEETIKQLKHIDSDPNLAS